MSELIVIGGGLAGCEAAWQAATRGVNVSLYEMRPYVSTPAHQSGNLAELVCSNSLGSHSRNRPAGLLHAEMKHLNSFVMRCAEETAIPAGGALAVDRERFSSLVTERLHQISNINIICQEITRIPNEPVIIATGPLTSEKLATRISELTDTEALYFYDAIAPIITMESVNLDKAFWGSRYTSDGENQGDYLNCPFTEEEYLLFISELVTAERIRLKAFEADINQGVRVNSLPFFESCLPVEVLAGRHPLTLSYGPLRPVGIRDPHTNRYPYAILQLRQENLAKTLLNLVGFQTNLTHEEQERVFRLIPGLENAVFVRFGQMHRNTYINSPLVLEPTTQFKARHNLFFAGQIIGIEGYAGNIASGLVAGINASRLLNGQPQVVFPCETMIGALHHYISNANPEGFQPMKANFGLLPEMELCYRSKKDKKFAFAKRSLRELSGFCQEKELLN